MMGYGTVYGAQDAARIIEAPILPASGVLV